MCVCVQDFGVVYIMCVHRMVCEMYTLEAKMRVTMSTNVGGVLCVCTCWWMFSCVSSVFSALMFPFKVRATCAALRKKNQSIYGLMMTAVALV